MGEWLYCIFEGEYARACYNKGIEDFSDEWYGFSSLGCPNLKRPWTHGIITEATNLTHVLYTIDYF